MVVLVYHAGSDVDADAGGDVRFQRLQRLSICTKPMCSMVMPKDSGTTENQYRMAGHTLEIMPGPQA